MLEIKVCGLNRPDNILALLDQTAVDYIGLIFYEKSPRKVSFGPGAQLDEIKSKSKEKLVKKVGVFVDEEMDVVLDKADIYGLDIIQLHGKETVEYCDSLKKAGHELVKAFSIKESGDAVHAERYKEVVDHYLFDTKGDKPGGNGIQFNWNILKGYDFSKSFWLSGGIGPEAKESILEYAHPQLKVVDVNSRFEKSPGVKNVGMVKDFIDHLNCKTYG